MRAALADGAPPREIAHAAERIVDLAERGFRNGGGDEAAVHLVLHDLFFPASDDAVSARATWGVRHWLAKAACDVWTRHVPEADEVGELAPEEFAALVQREHESRSGRRHPLSMYFFEGSPTLAQVRLYLHHHWHRSRDFYALMMAFAQGQALEHAAPVVENLYEEAGSGEAERAHPHLLQKLLRHLDIPCAFDDRPWLPEARAYLNNRMRCARHPRPEWGLAVLYSIEYGTPVLHGEIHRMLRRLGIAEEYCEFHRIHSEVDQEHAAELLELAKKLVTTREAQRTFVSSLRYHRGLASALYARILTEVEALEPATR